MIERIKTPIFNKLTKHVDLLDLRQNIGNHVMSIVSNIANGGASPRLRSVEVNSKNIEYTEVFTLQEELQENPYPIELIEEVQSDLRKLAVSDIRIRTIVMRVGSYSYYVCDLIWLWAPKSEDELPEADDTESVLTQSSDTGV